MPSLVQLLVAVAVTGLLVGFDRPALLVVGALAGLWPDFLAWALSPLQPRPDVLITPAPDHPDAALVAAGLQAAACAAVAEGRPWRVRLNPLPAWDGATACDCAIDLDRQQRATVRLGTQTSSLRWRGWLPRHPLPLRVSTTAADLVLTPLPGGRLASEMAPAGHPAGHTWLWPPALLIAAVASPEAALVAGVVTALHLALDYGSHATLAPGWPLSARTTGGLRTWDGSQRRTAVALGGVAGLVLAVATAADAQVPWVTAHPARALALVAVSAGLAVAVACRRLRASPPARR